MTTRCEKGRLGEDIAAEHAVRRGMQVVARNFRCPLGEIDLIAMDGATIVFVEVKSRYAGKYGVPQESVTPAKQRRLTRLAQWYMKEHGFDRQPARFDVVAVTWNGGQPQITWLVNAFEALQ